MKLMLASLIAAGRHVRAEAPEGEVEISDEAALATLGRESEELRRRQDDALASVRMLSALESDLGETFERTRALFAELAEVRAELLRREAVEKVQREAYDAAQARLADLGAQHERVQSELETRRLEVDRLNRTLGEVEAQSRRSEGERAALGERLATSDAALESARSRIRAVEEEIAAVRSELEGADRTASDLHAELAGSLERTAVAEATAAELARQGDEARLALARAETELAGANDALSALRAHSARLAEEVESMRAEAARQRASIDLETEKRREEIAALTAKLTHATALESVRERILQDQNGEIAAMTERVKASERRLADAERDLSFAVEARTSAETARADAETAVERARAGQKRLLRRVTPLIAALRKAGQETETRNRHVAELESRLEAAARAQSEAREQADARIAILTAELETERARRVLAEAAILEDRAKAVASRPVAQPKPGLSRMVGLKAAPRSKRAS